MTEQQTPFDFTDRPAVRGNDPGTARAAWAKVSANGKLRERYRAILEALRLRGPQTCKEIAAGLGWDRDSVSPRIPEMRRAGLVSLADARRDRQQVYEARDLA